ncbi:MAG TPA: T9SS type A sorting domain-containing protein [Bacteroidia bacterium]|nr:T9SS type A sorting domain-containing protein [Bacteroidia bacterium]
MSRKIILLCISYFIFNVKSNAQPTPFQKSFGDSLYNEFGISVIQLNSGSIFFCGYKYNVQLLSEITLSKLDMNGNILWQQYYNDSAQSLSSGNMIYHNNSFYIAGQTMYQNGNVDALVLKIDTAGNLIWQKKYGGLSANESFACIEADSVYGFMCSGFATASTGSGNDIYIARLDTNGNLNWAANYGSLLNDVSMAIKRTPDGNFILSGDKLVPASSDYNAYVLKIDSAGNTIWDADIVNSFNSGCRNIMVNHDGDYILVGESATPTSSYFDVLVSKISQAGSVQWAKTIPATDLGDAGFSIIEPVPDHYLVTGYGYNMNDSSTDVVLLHIDSGGNEISKRYYGFDQLDFGFEISHSVYGGFLIAGTNYGLDNQYYLIYDTISIPVAVNEMANSQNNFHAYPNVLTGGSILYFNKALRNFSVTVFDPVGKNIYYDFIKEATTQYSFKTFLASGFYMLKISSENSDYTRKIIFRK